MDLTKADILQLVNHIGDQEKHFNGLETQYRLLASSWLLASLGAMGYLMQNDKSTWLLINVCLLISAIGFVASIGIILWWILDMKVYHKLLHCVFIQGILLEQKHDWLPKIRTDMLLSQETGDVTKHTGLYYMGSVILLQLISLLSLINNYGWNISGYISILFGIIFIFLVVHYMRKSNSSARAKMLFEKLKKDYKDEII